MVSEGKVSAEEGARLLDSLRSSYAPQSAKPVPERSPSRSPRWLHVRVTNLESGRAKVNVNVPLGLVKVGIKMGGRFAPETDEIDWEELMAAIQEGAEGKLVEVEDQEGGERVEVYVD
jgi:hypothetical protein